MVSNLKKASSYFNLIPQKLELFLDLWPWEDEYHDAHIPIIWEASSLSSLPEAQPLDMTSGILGEGQT